MDELLKRLLPLQYKLLLFGQQFGRRMSNITNTVIVLLSVLGIGNVVWQIGFESSEELTGWMIWFNKFAIVVFGVIQVYKLLYTLLSTRKIRFIHILYVVGIWLYINYMNETEGRWSILGTQYFVDGFLTIFAVYELSSISISFLTQKSSPTMLFAGSFMMIIAIGTGLLLMPRCHYYDMTFWDAFFTSTSSVCVTGMMLNDISRTFTPFGLTIILLLVQVGGIGVMTFTCFFAMSLSSKTTMHNQIVIKDLVSADNMSDIFAMLKHIMYVTFLIEGVASWVLYYHFREALPGAPRHEVIFTAIFHGISAFCNAGLSNLPDGLSNPIVSHNKSLHLVVAMTIIFGGAGFPLQSAAINWIKERIRHLTNRIIGRATGGIRFNLRIINASNRLIFYTNIILLALGTIFFMISEWSHTQEGLGLMDRLSDSFFLSASSRTAGFLYRGITEYSTPTLILLMAFMWIGCAPLSTGGGVKVTTFALGVLNVRNTLLGRDCIEIFGRRVSSYSLRRAYTIMSLTIFAILLSTIALKTVMPEMDASRLLFESCAALSTAGMSLDTTPMLNTAGKMIIMTDMFIGRIGVMAFLMIFITPKSPRRYKYPSENIML